MTGRQHDCHDCFGIPLLYDRRSKPYARCSIPFAWFTDNVLGGTVPVPRQLDEIPVGEDHLSLRRDDITESRKGSVTWSVSSESKKLLGARRRLAGQKRVPLPPAMMIA